MAVLYGMVQPFLAEETRTKIHILGSKGYMCDFSFVCSFILYMTFREGFYRVNYVYHFIVIAYGSKHMHIFAVLFCLLM